jgi:hypothetical protein
MTIQRMRTLATGTAVVLAFIVAQSVWAQDSSLQENKIKLSWKGGTLHLNEAGRNHDIPLDGQFDAAEIESVKLRSAKAAKGFIYLLLDVTGPSKLPRDKSECGNRSESDLIWIKLDANWSFKEGSSFLYNSCLLPITAVDGPAWDGDIYRVKTKNQMATYNSAHPEDGLKIADAAAAK